MRIAYLGKFQRVWDEEAIARAFEAVGCEVLRIEESEYHDYKRALKATLDFKADIFLGAKMGVDNSFKLIQALKQAGVPTISWTFDLIKGHPPRETIWKHFPFFYCDHVFMTDGGRVQEYRDEGIDYHVLRQGIPDEYCYRGEKEEKYEHDIIFVGTHNPTFPYRQDCADFLKKKYGDRFIWFGYSNAHEIRGHELNKLYSSAKIVIGDSMFGDNYWSNRIYETLGRGGFLIITDIEGLEKEYTPYKHYIPYRWGDFELLGEKIDYFLEHPEKREEIQQAAFEHTQKNYKMSDRARQFLEIYETIKSSKR